MAVKVGNHILTLKLLPAPWQIEDWSSLLAPDSTAPECQAEQRLDGKPQIAAGNPLLSKRNQEYLSRVTVLEVINRGTEFLQKKGIESARLHSELLLAHVLHMPRLKLYLQFERQLAPAEEEAIRAALVRRGNREPLQHITGSVSFCGYEIKVAKDALIPRPETELLAEKAWSCLKALPSDAPRFLDFGTGTGCISIAIAKECPKAAGTCLDISEPALALARNNAETNGCLERLTFLLSNGFESLNPGEKFDLIVSNPPYIPTAEIEQLDPEVRIFDPHLALNGGPDGLEFYRLLARAGKNFLVPGGRLFAEFGDGQESDLAALFADENWIVEKFEPDYTGRMRILTAGVGAQ
jgi:release factor glutamine methyltransferase